MSKTRAWGRPTSTYAVQNENYSCDRCRWNFLRADLEQRGNSVIGYMPTTPKILRGEMIIGIYTVYCASCGNIFCFEASEYLIQTISEWQSTHTLREFLLEEMRGKLVGEGYIINSHVADSRTFGEEQCIFGTNSGGIVPFSDVEAAVVLYYRGRGYQVLRYDYLTHGFHFKIIRPALEPLIVTICYRDLGSIEVFVNRDYSESSARVEPGGSNS